MILETAAIIIVGGSAAAWVLSQLLGRPRPEPPRADAKLRVAARALKEGTATAAQLREASKVAEVAGDYELAEQFGMRAMIYGELEQARREASRRSALPDVTDEAWRGYVAAARQVAGADEPNYVSERFKLGLYGLDARTLADIGVMRGLRKGEWQGHEVWLAEWAPSASTWLDDPEQQYASLAKLSRVHAKTIAKKYASKLGTDLEPGKPMTLSGLLAVARIAGLGGLARFVDGTEEDRFPNTLRAYRASNGLF